MVRAALWVAPDGGFFLQDAAGLRWALGGRTRSKTGRLVFHGLAPQHSAAPAGHGPCAPLPASRRGPAVQEIWFDARTSAKRDGQRGWKISVGERPLTHSATAYSRPQPMLDPNPLQSLTQLKADSGCMSIFSRAQKLSGRDRLKIVGLVASRNSSLQASWNVMITASRFYRCMVQLR
jgi:hypothetical protein